MDGNWRQTYTGVQSKMPHSCIIKARNSLWMFAVSEGSGHLTVFGRSTSNGISPECYTWIKGQVHDLTLGYAIVTNKENKFHLQ